MGKIGQPRRGGYYPISARRGVSHTGLARVCDKAHTGLPRVRLSAALGASLGPCFVVLARIRAWARALQGEGSDGGGDGAQVRAGWWGLARACARA